MPMPRSTKIVTLLVIDTVFFFVEITVGYTVHSLALVADSFHMLNDVFSLVVALWAIKLSRQKSTSNYTYGVSFSTLSHANKLTDASSFSGNVPKSLGPSSTVSSFLPSAYPFSLKLFSVSLSPRSSVIPF